MEPPEQEPQDSAVSDGDSPPGVVPPGQSNSGGGGGGGAVAGGGGGGGGGALREDQVQNAVQFLGHPKVQRASLEQRRKFLRNKGVTDAEFDEAVRIAKPDLSQVGTPQGPPPGNEGNYAQRPGQAPQRARPQRPLPEQQAPQYAPEIPAPSSSWGRVVMASLAVAALGSGVGLLAKKVVIPRIMEASAAQQEQQAAAAGAASGEAEEAAGKRESEMSAVMDKLDFMQATIDENARDLTSLSIRVSAIENNNTSLSSSNIMKYPAPADFKQDILSGITALLTQQTILDLKGELSALRSAVLSAPNTPGSAMKGESTYASTPDPKSVLAPTKPNVPVPAGLPNARVFKKLAAAEAAAAEERSAAAAAAAKAATEAAAGSTPQTDAEKAGSTPQTEAEKAGVTPLTEAEKAPAASIASHVATLRQQDGVGGGRWGG